MRIAPFAFAAFILLLNGCGGPETSQANNAQANISNESRDVNQAAASNVQARVSLGDAAKIMHDRHEAMEGLGKSMKALHRELDSGKPDINVIRAQTSTMASTAAKIPGFFPPGTGPDVGKTRAKPEIWKQQDLFIRKSKDFLAASQAIDAAARTGDVNKVMALHENVDKGCKACHDPFRAPKH
jgi:cytochrome c556